MNAKRLESDLRGELRGEVRFDAGSRALYATGGSNYRQVPIGVVIPRDAEDVLRAVEVCKAYDAPLFGRGGGTSLAGQCCNVAVVLDFSKYMNRVLEVDPQRRLARVEPGTVLDTLRAAAERYRLTFGPDPATHSHCTLGGMLGNNSCGTHSVMAQFDGPGARTSDNVETLEVLTYDGERLTVGATSDSAFEAIVAEGGRRAAIYRELRALRDGNTDRIRTGIPNIPRRVSGFNLSALLPEQGFNVAQAVVGSESTCVLLLQATVRLIPSPRARTLVVLGYPSVFEAADHVTEIMRHRPIACEGMDDKLVKDIESVGYETQVLQLLPPGGGFLLVEFGGNSKAEADEHAHGLLSALGRGSGAPPSKLFDDPVEEQKVWKVREAGLGATAHVERDRPTWEGWEDTAVPPESLGRYLRQFRALLDKHGLHGDLYGHFGQGCVHTRIDFDLETARGIRAYRRFVEEGADLVASFGGSLSGEHGDGQSRGELLPRMYGPELMAAFHKFKEIWDPAWKMNPGKVIDPYPLDSNLRLGTSYRPPALRTQFHYHNAEGSFAKATLRCVGVGECRRLEGGTMCPSYRVTREEMHSTRGRARLLFEMLEGDPLTGGWQDEHVKEALDLCLACKGCKGDCPVSVDMATYKAEFLSHYYEGHRRPLTAFTFGLISRWARLASFAPRAANTFTQTPILRTLAKLAAGMPLARSIPPFAPRTFQQWFAARRPPSADDSLPAVVLWPDTFNNHFHPETAIAAVRVLERCGFRVLVPRERVCCGRPLYDYGMIDTARSWLRDAVRTMRPFITAGLPIVALEPSCAAVFRDELRQVLPDDEDAKRLSGQVLTLGEFLQQEAGTGGGFTPPPLHRKAVVHGHCHQKAIMKMDADLAVLDALGLDYELLDSGCCGMAGSFGFERSHYDVSMAVGELALLPAVRRQPKETLIVADGFSCRQQIAQGTDRRALHLAQVVEMAYQRSERAGEFPEREHVEDYASTRIGTASLAAGALGAILVAAFLLRRRSAARPAPSAAALARW